MSFLSTLTPLELDMKFTKYVKYTGRAGIMAVERAKVACHVGRVFPYNVPYLKTHGGEMLIKTRQVIELR